MRGDERIMSNRRKTRGKEYGSEGMELGLQRREGEARVRDERM